MEFVKLGEICEPKSSKIKLTDVNKEGKYKVFGASGFVGFLDSFDCKNEYVGIIKDGAGIGRTDSYPPESSILGTMQYLLPKEGINCRFLKYAVISMNLGSSYLGATIPHIYFKDYKNNQIRNYDKSTQQKIVDVLDNINSLIKTKETELAQLDSLVQSQFAQMFGDKEFNLCCIREVVDTNKISAKKRYKDTDEINYIDISSIDNNQNIISTYTKYIFKDAPSRAQQCLMKRDILISTVRPNLKNIALFDEEGDFVGSSGFCILRSKKCNPYFLLQVVLTDKFTDEMISLTTGASYPAIKDDDILNFKIPLPPIELQNKFASFVQQVDKTKSILNAQILQLKELLNSKMDEYFSC